MTSPFASGQARPERLLDVQNLSVSFAGKEVVHGIDFSIAPGEKLALVGESGSGKTVTALSLLRLVQNAVIGGRADFAAGGETVDLLALPERQLRGRQSLRCRHQQLHPRLQTEQRMRKRHLHREQ